MIMLRTLDHADVETFASAASVPVINAMSARSHPCQLLADIQTYVETPRADSGQNRRVRRRRLQHVQLVHRCVVASSGFDLKIACPKGFEPAPELLASTNRATLVATPQEAVRRRRSRRDRRVVFDGPRRRKSRSAARRFAGYQVDESLLDLAATGCAVHALSAGASRRRGQRRRARRSALGRLGGSRQSTALAEGVAGVPASRQSVISSASDSRAGPAFRCRSPARSRRRFRAAAPESHRFRRTRRWSFCRGSAQFR